MTVAGWRFWHTDGRTYSSVTHRLEEVPADGVLVLMLYFDENGYRQICMGDDWYFHNPVTGVWGHNSDAREEILARYGAETMLWRGRWTTRDDYQRVSQAAMDAEAL